MKRIIDISDDTFNILKNMIEADCVDPYSLADIIVNKSIPYEERPNQNDFVSSQTEVVKVGEPLPNSDEINKALVKGKLYERGFKEGYKRAIIDGKTNFSRQQCKTCNYYCPYYEQFSNKPRGDGYCTIARMTPEGMTTINCNDEFSCSDYEREDTK